MFSVAPVDGTSNELCDWIELSVLSSPHNRTLLSDVNLDLEIEEDFEPEDLGAQGEVQERRVAQVVAAFDERTACMPTAYPFARNGDYISLKPEVTEGGAVYMFCLIVSNCAKNGLLSGEKHLHPNLNAARNLFQACATVSAAGCARGSAYSVGWPRADSSSFLDKLKEVYAHMGDGTPHPAMLSWHPKSVKDDEIDVIAWRQELDGRPATMYYLVQAASGANWVDKSVKSAIAVFHDTWFTQAPASHPNPVIAIPFCLPSPCDAAAADHEEQSAIAGELWRTSSKMGYLLYRSRVAQYVDDALTLPAGVRIEQRENLPNVRLYVDEYRERLRAAVAEAI